jgi:multidrug efflux pump
MSISTPFIRRPIATILLTLGLTAAGAMAFFQLPVSPLPQVDYPTISVRAQLPGASPEVVAATVATPLERHLGLIADVAEMTSISSVGSARITLQFGLDRNIDGAARDVQAAINAARADLPSNLRSNPTYRKVNSADAPILILALSSDTLGQGQLYDAANTTLAQRLSQVEGIGDVTVGGSSLPAVRVEINPSELFKYRIGLEDVRAALAAANAHSPKGDIEAGDRHYQIYDNDQASTAAQYRSLLIAYRNAAPVRLSDVADVVDSVENLRNAGLANGKPSVLLVLFRQPGANIIDTVDRVMNLLPQLRASISPAIDITVTADRSTTIRASLREVERTLMIAIGLVVVVVFAFLRSVRAALIPTVAVPASLIGTFGVMYLLNYSLDNLSLMALTIATGFVVDDAIVVLENVSRHMEAGVPRLEAAIRGAKEVSFTVLSMSLSLVAVFIPILLMGGIVGRLFREFAVTLSAAILISLVISLVTTPMMCALVLAPARCEEQTWLHRASEHLFGAALGRYEGSLAWALRHPRSIMLVLFGTLCFAIYLYVIIPKGLFPQQDTGRLTGGIEAGESISFQLMRQKFLEFMSIVQRDPAVESVAGFIGGGQTNSGSLFVSLKPIAERRLSADQVIERLRSELKSIPGASLYLQAVQDFRAGGRPGNGQYQYTLQADEIDNLAAWMPRVVSELRRLSQLKDVNTDQEDGGLESDLSTDRVTAARLGVNIRQVDNTLYDAFGQRQVSTIYDERNQYHVVMEVAPQFWQDPGTLKDIFVSTSGGGVGGVQGTNAVVGTVYGRRPSLPSALIAADPVRNQAINALANSGRGAASTGTAVSTSAETMVPLSDFSTTTFRRTPVAINHQGAFVASTISFNLASGVTLSQAVSAIESAIARLRLPASIHGSFQGTARVFRESLGSEPYLIVAALATVYIVLGILYESYVHPLTILSTLPSAGIGAVLALMLLKLEFSIVSLIGVILLIGIVKKNAIMMIDFALDAQRARGLSSIEAISEACLRRFRPIIMTSAAAVLGALPLAFGLGEGGELRRPLGVTVVGGLIISQLLTLYTTPVIYLYLDRFRLWSLRLWRGPVPPILSLYRTASGE